MEPLPICPKSGLLRTRCKCSDCYPFWRPYKPRLSRGAKRNRKKRLLRVKAGIDAQQRWIDGMLAEHRAAHPHMWGDADARDN